MPDSERKRLYDAGYDAENTRHYSVKLNLKTDADIVAALLNQPSIQGYIKQALREKIARDNENK